jgi:hypothetical protein
MRDGTLACLDSRRPRLLWAPAASFAPQETKMARIFLQICLRTGLQSLQAGVDAGHPGVYALGHLPNPTDIEGLDLQITGKRGLSPSNFRVRPQQSALPNPNDVLS